MRRSFVLLALAVLLAACSAVDDASQAVDEAQESLDEVQGAASELGDLAEQAEDALAEATALGAELTGDAEVPGPGDDAASGTADLRLSPQGQVCATIDSDLDAPMAAHIHRGGDDVAGDVVIDLTDALGGEEACVDAEPALLGEIGAEPAGFYVNVHTEEFPDGAIRGQLARG